MTHPDTLTANGRPKHPPSQPESRDTETKPAFAALDLGTNNCRLLVAQPSDDTGFRVIDSFSRVVRLGEGMAHGGDLKEEAIQRTLNALKICAGKMGQAHVVRTRSVATEACRRAENCQPFLDRVRSETGIELEPITPEEEAHLTLRGCSPLLQQSNDGGHHHALVFDIGGGSTDITWAEYTNEGDDLRPIGTLSIPVGVVSFAERFGHDRVDPATYAVMTGEVDSALADFDAKFAIRDAINDGTVHMLGASGTVTSLAAIHLDLQRYDRSRVDGLTLETATVHEICDRLSGMNLDERAAIPTIGAARADLAVAGFAILEALCKRWPAPTLTVADRGIREGILLSMMMAAKQTNEATQ